MSYYDSDSSFEGYLALLSEAGLSLESITPDEAFSLFFNFYKNVRFEGCDLDRDGDMLLFQWEPYQLDLTRQFIFTYENEPDEDVICQLNIIFQFSETIPEMEGGNKWCYSLEELDAFKDFVDENRLYIANRSKKCVANLGYQNAG